MTQCMNGLTMGFVCKQAYSAHLYAISPAARPNDNLRETPPQLQPCKLKGGKSSVLEGGGL